MLKHNIKLFIRNIKKNKSTFFINTIGLGIGIASFLLLAIYLHNDLTYNHFHENFSNIYRVRDGESTQTKGLVLPKMLNDIPEIVNGTRIFDWDVYRLSYNANNFQENVYYVDKGFFSMFSFPFIEGSAKNGIEEKYGAVISRAFAKKYFGEKPAFGEKLQIQFGDKFFEVKGVVDIPENSSVKFDIVTSYETGETISPWIKDVHDWYNQFSTTYVQLKEGIKPEDIDDKLQKIVTENYLPVGENTTDLNIIQLSEYHETEESNQTLMIILAIIALGIIGIAIVNFINLTINNMISRIKEIGIKKVHGATRSVIFSQILTESFLLSFMAVTLGVLMMIVLLPTFNNLFETNLYFDPWQHKIFLLIMAFIWGTVGLLSGLISTLFWSKGKLTENLKGNLFSGKRGSNSRYSLIFLQFVIAMVLISSTFLVRKQINAMLNKDPKFDKENVVVVQTDSWQYENIEKVSQDFKRISEELRSSPFVESVSFSGNIPGVYSKNYNAFYPESGSSLPNISLRKSYVGQDYFKTLGVNFINGAGFDQPATALKNSVVLNKKAMEELGFSEAREQIIREGSQTGESYKIIGVIDNFDYQGVQSKIEPLAHFYVARENYADWNYLLIKAKAGENFQVIDQLKKKWEKEFPGASLTYFFADEKLNEQYKEYMQINTLVTWFSILSVLLSCIGLFALSAYAIAKRTREIGIRKVNGATISQILILLNTDFIKWVGLAFIAAAPISWYALQNWLEGFAYKTTISWWVFALSGLIALSIAIITVSFHAISAATANPVKSLRSE